MICVIFFCLIILCCILLGSSRTIFNHFLAPPSLFLSPFADTQHDNNHDALQRSDDVEPADRLQSNQHAASAAAGRRCGNWRRLQQHRHLAQRQHHGQPGRWQATASGSGCHHYRFTHIAVIDSYAGCASAVRTQQRWRQRRRRCQ